jgi:hypothetical protein
MMTECNGKKVVLLKFNNRNNYKIKVSWKEVFKTQLEQQTESFRGQKQLVIAPGEIFESDCTNIKYKECLITSDQVSAAYGAEILKFDFKDINVSKA